MLWPLLALAFAYFLLARFCIFVGILGFVWIACCALGTDLQLAFVFCAGVLLGRRALQYDAVYFAGWSLCAAFATFVAAMRALNLAHEIDGLSRSGLLLPVFSRGFAAWPGAAYGAGEGIVVSWRSSVCVLFVFGFSFITVCAGASNGCRAGNGFDATFLRWFRGRAVRQHDGHEARSVACCGMPWGIRMETMKRRARLRQRHAERAPERDRDDDRLTGCCGLVAVLANGADMVVSWLCRLADGALTRKDSSRKSGPRCGSEGRARSGWCFFVAKLGSARAAFLVSRAGPVPANNISDVWVLVQLSV